MKQEQEFPDQRTSTGSEEKSKEVQDVTHGGADCQAAMDKSGLPTATEMQSLQVPFSKKI